MSRPVIVFDLDGTLVDTAPDLLDSLNHVIIEEGLEPIAAERLRAHVGQGGRVMIERAHTAQGRSISPTQIDALVARFVAHYSAGMPGHSRPFEGATECIARFARAGFATAVCTNKYEALSKRLLAAMQMDDSFAAICGADTFDVRKPDPGHLFGTIVRAGGDRDRALMVGDSSTDIDTAKAAGIPVVAVDFGYAVEPIETLGADHVISHFDELTPALAAQLGVR